MRRSQVAVLAVAWVLSLGLIWSLSGPAEAHDVKEGGAYVHYTIHFPETDDEEIARIYATTHIVTVYLQEKGTSGYQGVGDLIRAIKKGLE